APRASVPGDCRRARGAGILAARENIAAMRIAVAASLLAVLAAGGGSNSSSVGEAAPPATTVTGTTRQQAATTETSVEQPLALQLYFLAPDGELAALTRFVERTQTPGATTLHELTDPPEGLRTEVPSGLQLTIEDGRADVTGARLNPPALAQVVYAL